jgi:hypothetical protein
MSKEIKNYGSKQHGCGITDLRIYGATELRNYGFTETSSAGIMEIRI